MKQGVLVYDQKSERMDVRFGLEDYYGGLHCGTCMDVFVNNRWKPTRIEYGWDERGWYLVGVPIIRGWVDALFYAQISGQVRMIGGFYFEQNCLCRR